ncbi:MAG: SUF system NifU family Fe-S cluster assembly protein [Planctomycetota bacterium]|nr:SUF system NifU family Fe-S cluster assembly protein [Planctomycetota bacterium]
MSNPIHDLYRKVVLDHYRNPRNKRSVEGADVKAEAFNAVCGDHVVLEGRIQDGRLVDIGVKARGCAISVASGSILTEILTGRPLADVERIRSAAEGIVRGGEIPPGEYGDLSALEGVRSFPVRLRCAMLAWEALAEGLARAGSEAS